jgi:hypothetical protein
MIKTYDIYVDVFVCLWYEHKRYPNAILLPTMKSEALSFIKITCSFNATHVHAMTIWWRGDMLHSYIFPSLVPSCINYRAKHSNARAKK